MLFSLFKHYLDTDTALKLSQSVYCFTTSISHGVENYYPRLWGVDISDAIFVNLYVACIDGGYVGFLSHLQSLFHLSQITLIFFQRHNLIK